ncbi:type I secretion system permease/ATPase [Mongoliimonas terrestris]|uniref:type I secretion system permease/ATPase n=1 Tax=Mongoliimonas terrestris TaxID=1709001 RepID=UPI000949641C|nr:type I secretion system permease/ATPase [Mongoliimonas terrestris]
MAALKPFRSALVGVAFATALINVLALTGSLFMMEVYDRVLPSRSLPTLVGLLAIAGVLFAFQGLLDLLRGRMLARIGAGVDEIHASRLIRSVLRLPLAPGGDQVGEQPLRDLDQVRSFLSGAGPAALFDLPWIPFYLAICFAFHPMIGGTALAGALVLVAVTALTEWRVRGPGRQAAAEADHRDRIVRDGCRAAEAVAALGMADAVADRWATANGRTRAAQQRTADVVSGFGALARAVRVALQALVLAVGAALAIRGEVTGGAIIASSILTARALAPVDTAIAHWRGFAAARAGWRRLGLALRAKGPDRAPMALPPPCRSITAEAVTAGPPGADRLTVMDATFRLEAGQVAAVLGPSGSGKSSLLRALVGVWPAAAGTVRLDGAALDQWAPAARGRHVGYLPQDVALMAGTVAENIARFDPDADPDAVVKAAAAAGAHDLIVRLPDGYDTRLGDGGSGLSAGQRQRIGLARALYRDPFLVVLDEPNANLDPAGEQALAAAIAGVKARAGIVLVAAHRPEVLATVDLVLVMGAGRIQAFGPRDQVLGLARPLAGVPAEARGTAAKPAEAAAGGAADRSAPAGGIGPATTETGLFYLRMARDG